MDVTTPHDYGCDCPRCRAIITAIIARNPDGSYFFNDYELLKLSLQREKWEGGNDRINQDEGRPRRLASDRGGNL